MSEIVEHVMNDGWAEYTIRVWAPADVWFQSGNGKPGFAEFAVHPVFGVQDGELIYQRPGWVSSGEDTVTDLADAEIEARGSVKWDGCVNYQVGEDDSMLHACDASGLRWFFQAIQRAYEIALEMVGGGFYPGVEAK